MRTLFLIFSVCFMFVSCTEVNNKKEIVNEVYNEVYNEVDDDSTLVELNTDKVIEQYVLLPKDSIVYFENSDIKSWHFQYLDSLLEGECTSYFIDGNLRTKENFSKGYRTGVKKQYKPNGILYKKSYYDNGCLKWREYYNDKEVLYMKSIYDEEKRIMTLMYKETRIDTGYATGRSEKACEGFISISNLISE